MQPTYSYDSATDTVTITSTTINTVSGVVFRNQFVSALQQIQSAQAMIATALQALNTDEATLEKQLNIPAGSPAPTCPVN